MEERIKEAVRMIDFEIQDMYNYAYWNYDNDLDDFAKNLQDALEEFKEKLRTLQILE